MRFRADKVRYNRIEALSAGGPLSPVCPQLLARGGSEPPGEPVAQQRGTGAKNRKNNDRTGDFQYAGERVLGGVERAEYFEQRGQETDAGAVERGPRQTPGSEAFFRSEERWKHVVTRKLHPRTATEAAGISVGAIGARMQTAADETPARPLYAGNWAPDIVAVVTDCRVCRRA